MNARRGATNARGGATNARGYSLLEALLATAVLGLVALMAGTLLQEVAVEARAAEASQVAFETRWLAVGRLRADVERASSASVAGSTLRLRGDGFRADWRACGDRLVRHAGPRAAAPNADCDRARFSVRAMGERTLVAWTLDGASGEAVLGGAL